MNPPVIVNSFNQPTYLKQIVEKFGAVSVADLLIIDQASTNPELLDFLSDIKGTATVIKLSENHGPHWFFMQGMALKMPQFYAYTDPDLRFRDDLPVDFLDQLVALADDLGATKIGSALDVSDIEDTIVYDIEIAGKKCTTLDWEAQFWSKKVPDDQYEIYQAAVDTTFALYNRRYFDRYLKHYRDVNLYDCMDTPGSFRIAGPFSVIHLPWSRSDPMTAQERDFYHSTKISIHNY